MYLQELLVNNGPYSKSNQFTVKCGLDSKNFGSYDQAEAFYRSLKRPGVLYQESPVKQVIHLKVYLEV